MSENNSSFWDGFDSIFGGESGMNSLSETEPSSQFISTMAENRQILNILFLVDVSGSMRGQRIGQVNYALENIFKLLRKRDDPNAQIKIGIMEFAEEAEWITTFPVPLDDYVFTQITATPWITCYGKAFDELNKVLSRSSFMDPARGEYFAPLILLVTDGEPTDPDEYPKAIERLKRNGWFNKSVKYAIAAGEESRTEEIAKTLSEFTGEIRNVRYADEGGALCDLIEFIVIRASEVLSSMVSRAEGGSDDYTSIFESPDSSLYSNSFM